MRTLLAVLSDFKIFFNPKTSFGKKRLLILLGATVTVIVGVKIFSGSEAEVEVEKILTEVEVRSVSELAAGASFDTVGKVEAVSEANLQAESSGRITTVNVKVGDVVGAGAVLATLENSAQRAVLVQAQGSYEAALAASAQSTIGLSEAGTAVTAAKNAAVAANNSAFNTANNIIATNIDTFFSNPDSPIPGLKISGFGYTQILSNERVAYKQIIPEWRSRVNTTTLSSNLQSELGYSKVNVERTIKFLDTFIFVFNESEKEDVRANVATFTSVRAALIVTGNSLDEALARIASAEDAARRAQLSASGGTVSVSDAQVKIALGSLQSAQSAYQKTIVRSPIQGVVNAFYLKTGDYVTLGQPAAIIANNNGLQIKAFVSEIDSANLSVGDAVSIEGGASGVITAKAAALDPSNGKVALIVGVNPDSGLTNGATVKITFSQISKASEDTRILVPLSALKITPDGDFVFTVSNSNKLQAVSITKGQLFGDNIEVLSGITKETRIVTDARGLKAEQEVTIK